MSGILTGVVERIIATPLLLYPLLLLLGIFVLSALSALLDIAVYVLTIILLVVLLVLGIEIIAVL